MIIDFKARRTTLVASPVDGRSGIPTLTTLAESLLGIPITKGEDYAVFVSRSRKVCKYERRTLRCPHRGLRKTSGD